jgi:hypothetical protein
VRGGRINIAFTSFSSVYLFAFIIIFYCLFKLQMGFYPVAVVLQ